MVTQTLSGHREAAEASRAANPHDPANSGKLTMCRLSYSQSSGQAEQPQPRTHLRAEGRRRETLEERCGLAKNLLGNESGA